MHARIIKPDVHGKAVYENKASCAALVKYLGHEMQGMEQLPEFFNARTDGISSEMVRESIDENVKVTQK